jgi:hypothetical protein
MTTSSTSKAVRKGSLVTQVTWPVLPTISHQMFMDSSVNLPSCDSRIIRESLG